MNRTFLKVQLRKNLFTAILLLTCTSSHSYGFIQGKERDAPATLLIFTGSDWCPNCRRLDKNILKDSAFINFTRGKISIEIADFPQHRKLEPEARERNIELAEKYHFKAIYPTILVLDSAGKVRSEISFGNQSSYEFINQLKLLLK